MNKIRIAIFVAVVLAIRSLPPDPPAAILLSPSFVSQY